MVKRIFLIVLDSLGIGLAHDAAQFGDEGANTLATIAKHESFHVPLLKRLGLFNIDGVDCGEREASPLGSFGRLVEASNGKDTTIGHWELAGIISNNPLPTYPNGFPPEILDEFERLTGRKAMCNKPYSGTDVIMDYGREHLATGDYIVYTSADSVFQIAAHEEKVPLETLYEDCIKARELLTGQHGVARVIARPFLGEYPNFTRTSNRRDFSLIPPKPTILDALLENQLETIGVGKIYDIFGGVGIKTKYKTKNNVHGMEKTIELANEDFSGLCFVNLVDFDMVYGHRNDIAGYAAAMTTFDKQLQELLDCLNEDDVLFITADHGCDPGFKGTDHTRENVPILVYGERFKQGINLKSRTSFADLAATMADIFGISAEIDGASFLELIKY